MSQPEKPQNKKTTTEVLKEINDDLKRRNRLPDAVMDAMLRDLMNSGLVSDVEPDAEPKYVHNDYYECAECTASGELKDVAAGVCPGCGSSNGVWIHNIAKAGKMNY